MGKIKATLYKTDGSHEPVLLSSHNSLQTLKKLVGGPIDVVHILDIQEWHDCEMEGGNDMVIHKHGNSLNLPMNPWSQVLGFNSIWEDEAFRGDIVMIEGRLP